MPPAYFPPNLSIATLNVPDQAETLSITDLPTSWRQHPPPQQLATMGSDWANSLRSLTLAVPSAIIPQEYNRLINPLHPDFHRVTILSVEPYLFDERLLP